MNGRDAYGFPGMGEPIRNRLRDDDPLTASTERIRPAACRLISGCEIQDRSSTSTRVCSRPSIIAP